MYSVQALATNYTNISEAYENYGFVLLLYKQYYRYRYRAEPDDYSEKSVKKIVNKLDDSSKNRDSRKSKNSDDKPNIIMIQLESFFDVDYMKNLKFSKDPLPVFHKLCQKLFQWTVKSAYGWCRYS